MMGKVFSYTTLRGVYNKEKKLGINKNYEPACIEGSHSVLSLLIGSNLHYWLPEIGKERK